MKLDAYSFSHNCSSSTPSWATAIVIQSGEYYIKEKIASDIIIGMLHKSVPFYTHDFSIPLGKGSKIYYGDGDFSLATSTPISCAIFDKVYVNNIRLNCPFILVILRDQTSHNGRLQLKYQPKIQFGAISNLSIYNAICDAFNVDDQTPWAIYGLDIINQDELHLSAIIGDNVFSDYDVISKQYENRSIANFQIYNSNSQILALQQIFYGAPGTGKSHTIDGMTNEKNSIRTTFHPDSDYASFVGAYKPMMDKVPVPEFNDKDKKPINEENKIVYKYEPQVFLKAYVEAWKRYLNRIEGEDDSYYLVIEEINRGNCAQIFGDIFQLLDRDENTGFSSYAISSDSAIAKYLAEDAACENSKFSELDFSDVTKNCDGVTKVIATADDLKSGKKLVLPPNLFIWATMNTSDQSLFPMDSAFKRRWEWVYVPIGYKNKDWKIVIGEMEYSWVEFQKEINKRIKDANESEDKQMGDYFVKANSNDVIDAKLLLNKIIFYLWNDVCKDGEGDIFYVKESDNSGKNISFSWFFGVDKEEEEKYKDFSLEKVQVNKLQLWLDSMNLKGSSSSNA